MRSKKKQPKVLVLLDFENLWINHPSRATFFEELDKALKQIAREVGAISEVFVFVPLTAATHFGEEFYQMRFTTVFCPRVKDKKEQEKDTVDEKIRDFGQKLLNGMPNLTHLIIGSGDADFLPLIIEASRRMGLDVGLIVNSLEQLAQELIKRIDKKPHSNEKMVYFLSPSKRKD